MHALLRMRRPRWKIQWVFFQVAYTAAESIFADEDQVAADEDGEGRWEVKFCRGFD